MAREERSVVWKVIGRSVRGASHRRGRIPNQDAIAWAPDSGSGSPLILSVADGHGAQASFRSAKGSALAVEAATGLLSAFLDEHGMADLKTLRDAAVRLIPRELTARWRRAVDEDAAKYPEAVSPVAYGSTI